LKRIVKARGSLDLQEAAALREAQQIQIWRQFGHTSLVDYMGAPGQAWEGGRSTMS
jgi:hypothetical protein